MNDPVTTALASAAEWRRRELPIVLALSVFGGGAAALVLGDQRFVTWAAVMAALHIFDAMLYDRLVQNGDDVSPRGKYLLGGWAVAISLTYIVLPSALWLDGRAATAAAAVCLWCGGILRNLSQITRRPSLAIASAAPGALSLVMVPIYRAWITPQADMLLVMLALVCAASFVAYAARFWLSASRLNDSLASALSEAGRKAELARALIEQSSMSACVVDRDRRLIVGNARFRTFCDITEADYGRQILDFAPWTPPHWADHIQNALSGAYTLLEEDEVDTPRGRIIFRREVGPVRDENGEIIAAVVHAVNITETVRNRRALEEAQARLELALSAASSIAWEINLRERTITWHGDPTAIYGFTPQFTDLMNKRSGMCPPEDHAIVMREIGSLAGGAPQCEFEHRVQHNGDVRWLQVWARPAFSPAGDIDRIIVLTKDVTSSKQDQEAFVSAMRWAEAAIESKRALIAETMGADAPLEAIPAHHTDITTRGDIAEMFARLGRLLKELDARDEALASAVASMRTSRMAAESANIAKSQFLANMSHELRTPLNAVIGYAEILREEAEADGRDYELVDIDRVLGAARQLLHLINEILDLSKIEAGRMDVSSTDFDVRGLVDRAADTVMPLAKKNGNTVVVDAPSDMGEAITDEFKLNQCLLNLLSNAAKFTKGGTLTLRARREHKMDRDWLIFAVEDTGIGMRPEELSRLFEPFTQADASVTRKFGGTGLGLAITRRMIELLGGSVEVRSVLDEGSCFTVRVPAQYERRPAHEHDPIALAPMSGPVIAVLDNDIQTRAQAEVALRRLGFAVETAACDDTGLALARRIDPALVIFDPAGDEAFARALAELPNAPPLVLHSEDHAIVRVVNICAVLTKPVAPEVIVSTAARFARFSAAAAPPNNTSETNFGNNIRHG